MKKAKAKGVMDGVPLTQEGVCQVLGQDRTETVGTGNISYRELYVQITVGTKTSRCQTQQSINIKGG